MENPRIKNSNFRKKAEQKMNYKLNEDTYIRLNIFAVENEAFVENEIKGNITEENIIIYLTALLNEQYEKMDKYPDLYRQAEKILYEKGIAHF